MDTNGDQERYFPIILVRGFDPTGASPQTAFYGFNQGAVYQNKQEGSRIFEGFVISFLKDHVRGYRDTTNVISFFEPEFGQHRPGVDPDGCFQVTAPAVQNQLGFTELSAAEKRRTFWVFRYYDALPGNIFGRRGFDAVPYFARELQRYIAAVKRLTGAPQVNIICHSMGGIITRHLVQRRYSTRRVAERQIHRIVSLGAPHGGIRYLHSAVTRKIASLFDEQELDAMTRAYMSEPVKKVTAHGVDKLPKYRSRKDAFGLNGGEGPQDLGKAWSARKWLCVIGTRYRDYQWNLGLPGEWLRGKQSDGLVAQDDAYVLNAPRAYLHKIHGGYDSLVSSRESFEVATRFLFGTHWIKLYLAAGTVLHGFNRRFEYHLGCSIKPRGVDFFLTQVDDTSENCLMLYKDGKFAKGFKRMREDLVLSRDVQVYEGALDLGRSLDALKGGARAANPEMVFRVDLVVYAEDNPLADPGGHTAGFALMQSDHKPVAVQAFAAVQQADPYLLTFHQHAGDAFALGVDELSQQEPVIDTVGGVKRWTYDNLRVETLRFDGRLRLEAYPIDAYMSK